MAQGVLVTGASTGIGYATALRLAESGFRVFAAVRNEQDAQRVRAAHARITTLLLDVTDNAQIAGAAAAIGQSGEPLRALVNNAGIAVAGPLEYLPLADLRRQFEVNLFGAIAVTQALLPAIRAARGRIVFVSSVSGRIAPPFIGPYAASKFALEAAADALRMELSAFGMAVSIVQPGNVKTPIWAKGRAEKPAMLATLPPEAIERYGSYLESLERVTESEERSGIDPRVVADAILHAVSDTRPRARYVVGSPPAWQRMIATLLPERVRDKMILSTFQKHGVD